MSEPFFYYGLAITLSHVAGVFKFQGMNPLRRIVPLIMHR